MTDGGDTELVYHRIIPIRTSFVTAKALPAGPAVRDASLADPGQVQARAAPPVPIIVLVAALDPDRPAREWRG